MSTPRWLVAVPLALAATFGVCGGPARAASVRDTAGLFSKDAVSKADRILSEIRSEYQLNANIETIPSLDGEDVRDVAERRAKGAGADGLFVLIVKKEKELRVLASKHYTATMGTSEAPIRKAFRPGFQKGDFDAGLIAGVEAIKSQAAAAHAQYGTLRENLQPGGRAKAVAPVRGRAPINRGGGFGIGGLVMLVLGIVVVMSIIRLIGSMFGGGARSGPGMGMGMGGRGGYGPGYGGGGGGGFMSGLFGGIGGALAGNWLYDQFSGRHGGGYSDAGNTDVGGQSDVSGADEWSGGTGSSGGWGDSGGGGGGGDWGGGGGGDWGGGGGDGGGGGGDW